MTDVPGRVQALLDDLVGSGLERGVQVAAYQAGQLVVDAWAGVADAATGRVVDGETLFTVFSATKGITATVIHLLADRGLELAPATGGGRASRFRAEPDGTWTGLDGYYTGEPLRLVRGPDGTVDHLDLGSFVLTREPYGPDAPLAARPDPEGWRAF